MREFNYTGPVYPDEHYVISRSELIEDIKQEIDKGKYFVIFAPRQMGKTSFIQHTIERLHQSPNYVGVHLDFETYSNLTEKEFYHALHNNFRKWLLRSLKKVEDINLEGVDKLFEETLLESNIDFYNFMEKLGLIVSPKKIVILIDEFDAVPIEITKPFLLSLREMYIQRREEPGFSPYSVALVGVKNITELNLGSQSPFNIARAINIKNFTLQQVRDLIGQYVEESGQQFAPGVIEKIYEETDGQPFLVNRLCAVLTEELVREGEITLENLAQALEILANENNSNFSSLETNARRDQELILSILFGTKDIKYNPRNQVQRRLIMYGVIKEADTRAEIANPIYHRVLWKHFKLEDDNGLSRSFNGEEFRSFITPTGKINMLQILIRFKEFIERVGIGLFDLTDHPREAVGQYLLMSYLDLFMRTVKGHLLLETPSGRGRLDILLLYAGGSYVVETKIWRGKVAFEYALEQVERYAGSEHVDEGYLVFFDQRIKDEVQENRVWDEVVGGVKVVCLLIHI